MSIYNADCTLVHESGGQRFYIGSLPSDYKMIPAKVIICCVRDLAKNSEMAEVLHIPFMDSMYPEDQPTEEQLRRWLKAMYAIVDGRDVFVHCYAGMNRSALILALYLMEYHLEDFGNRRRVVEALRSKRHPLLQNSHFEKIIEKWKLDAWEEDVTEEYGEVGSIKCECGRKSFLRLCPYIEAQDGKSKNFCSCCEACSQECLKLLEDEGKIWKLSGH